MNKILADLEGGGKPYDLEERTYLFAQEVRAFIKLLPRTMANFEDGRQLIRASGSVAANYIEANENLGPKDFRMRVKISRKESKESRLFLRLMDTRENPAAEIDRQRLMQEATELVRIFSAMIRNSSS